MFHLIVLLIVISALVRLITLPFRYGCRRRHGILGGILPILALVALDRIFTRRF